MKITQVLKNGQENSQKYSSLEIRFRMFGFRVYSSISRQVCKPSLFSAEFFDMVDTNDNGFVSVHEVESLFDSNVRPRTSKLDLVFHITHFRI